MIQQSKINSFINSITDAAAEKRSKVSAETQDILDAERAIIEAKAKKTAEDYFRARTAEIRLEAGKRISESAAECRKEVFGRRNLSKGVKVVTKNDSTTVDLYVIVKYGHRIPDLAYEIQENVKSTIESLSGITVDAVNIHIQGIDYSEDSEIKIESESDTE